VCVTSKKEMTILVHRLYKVHIAAETRDGKKIKIENHEVLQNVRYMYLILCTLKVTRLTYSIPGIGNFSRIGNRQPRELQTW